MSKLVALLTASIVLFACKPAAFAKLATSPPPEELGDVAWLRDYEEALSQAGALGKPVLILFQEVPGCSNCTRYGNEVLSDPLIVEAIESLFVPLAVFNSKGGEDERVLQHYGEPAFNNPVVRIVDAAGEDIVERLPDFRSPAQLTGGMIRALRRSGSDVPGYLTLLHEELRSGELATATFQTACFWSGEAFFGERPGVVATEAGWQNGREVVRVTYDPATVAPDVLAQAASERKYSAVESGKFRHDDDTKYYLQHSPYAKVQLTELQASRVNAVLGRRENPEELLSPKQLASIW